MSANNINDSLQLPVWTVHGVNWQADIPLNEFNAQFVEEWQAYEAATKAIETFKGENNGLVIMLDEGETIPQLGTTMIAHIKDTDPTKGYLPLTHVALANAGYYKDSIKLSAEFFKQFEAIKQEQAEHAKLLEEEIKNFDKFKAEQKKRKVKKSKKKSVDNQSKDQQN